jgi:hypothetical protein
MKRKIRATLKRESQLKKNKESKAKMFNAKIKQIKRDDQRVTDKNDLI